jgi:hypothetical protein
MCVYHERIGWCPLYVLSHGGKMADGEIAPDGQDGCVVDLEKPCKAERSVAKHNKMIATAKVKYPRFIAIMTWRVSVERRKHQINQNMKLLQMTGSRYVIGPGET